MIRGTRSIRFFIFLLPLIAVCCRLSAQSVDAAVLSKYDAGVVARLFSIVKYVKVEPPLQLQMAEIIHIYDSTIKNWIGSGKSSASVDTLQQMAQFRLYGMLTRDQLQAYKYYSNQGFATAIASGEADYIKKEYNPDSITYNEIKRSLSNKYNYILHDLSDIYLVNHAAAAGHVKELAGIYDEYKYFPLLYAAKYINEYIEKLGAIKKIPGESLEKIQHSFYNMLWKDKYTDWSLAAENATRMYAPDTVLFAALHGREYEQEAARAFETEKYGIIFRDHVTEGAFKDLEGLIKEKHYKEAVLRGTYALYYPQRYNQASRANMAYYDSLIKATMIYDGSLQPATQFAIALKYKEELGLRSGLCDTLVRYAMYEEKVRDSIFYRDPFAGIDLNAYECQYLTQLLTEDQYSQVLFQKNRTYSAATAQADWDEMVIRGLDRGFIKDQTVKEITDYYIVKNGAWCRYANDKVRLWANQRALEDIKPKALKVLDPIRWSGATEKAKNNMQLQW